jgi:signal transduction histidine kinase
MDMDPDTLHKIPNGQEKPEGTGAPAGDAQAIATMKLALGRAEKKLQIVGSVTRHDILNQLTTIMGYNELLSTMVQDKEQLHFLEVERRASEKMQRILAYSKVFQTIGTEPARWQNVGMLVRLARDELNTGEIPIRADVGTYSVYADLLFSKVLAYLIDNAIRHGERTTEIRIHMRSGGEGYVLLLVEDDGCGIAPAEKEKIFERGFGKRTGWGLFVAREILAAQGMTIREHGTAGAGASFEIRIPAGRVRTGNDSTAH